MSIPLPDIKDVAGRIGAWEEYHSSLGSLIKKAKIQVMHKNVCEDRKFIRGPAGESSDPKQPWLSPNAKLYAVEWCCIQFEMMVANEQDAVDMLQFIADDPEKIRHHGLHKGLEPIAALNDDSISKWLAYSMLALGIKPKK
jgi:hypothetical protein